MFHEFGINMRDLGKIALDTKEQFVRELCIVEMVARTCKKIMREYVGGEILS